MLKVRLLSLVVAVLPFALGSSACPGEEVEEAWLPATAPMTRASAPGIRLLRTLTIPDYVRGVVSQCTVVFSPDGRLLVGAGGRNRVPVWDLESGHLRHLLYDAPVQIVACAFRPDGEVIATAGFDGTIALWNAETGARMADLGTGLSSIWDLAFSADGSHLVSCSLSGDVRLWDLESGESVWQYPQSGGFLSVDVDAGGCIAYGALRNRVGILDSVSGERTMHPTEPTSHVGDVAFSPSGKRLAAGCDDRLIYLWDLKARDVPTTLRGHSGYVNGVAFMPDGGCLVSGSHDGTVGIWDLEAGARLATLEGHEQTVLRVAVNPSGTLIASISWDGTVRLWGVPAGTDE